MIAIVFPVPGSRRPLVEAALLWAPHLHDDKWQSLGVIRRGDLFVPCVAVGSTKATA
jgi:hypothetical protein